MLGQEYTLNNRRRWVGPTLARRYLTASLSVGRCRRRMLTGPPSYTPNICQIELRRQTKRIPRHDSRNSPLHRTASPGLSRLVTLFSALSVFSYKSPTHRRVLEGTI